MWYTKFMEHVSNLLNIIFLILVGWLAAYTAARKGRSAILWFFLGVFFNVFALLFLIFLPPIAKKRPQGEKESPFQGTTIDVKPLATNETTVDLKSPERQEWYYLDSQRQQTGPVTFDALKNLYKNSTISSSTYLWCEGMNEWRKLSELNLDVSNQ